MTWYRPPPVPLNGKIVLDEVQDIHSFTAPTKPLRLVSVTLDDEDPRAGNVSVGGVTVRLKSRIVT